MASRKKLLAKRIKEGEADSGEESLPPAVPTTRWDEIESRLDRIESMLHQILSRLNGEGVIAPVEDNKVLEIAKQLTDITGLNSEQKIVVSSDGRVVVI
jgi:hypothetical protein